MSQIRPQDIGRESRKLTEQKTELLRSVVSKRVAARPGMPQSDELIERVFKRLHEWRFRLGLWRHKRRVLKSIRRQSLNRDRLS